MKKAVFLTLIFVFSMCITASASRRVELGKNLPEPMAEFSDDFSDMNSWKTEKSNGADWHIVNDGENSCLTSGQIDTWGADKETIIVVDNDVSSSDFVFKADVSDKRYGAMASLVFKYTSPEHFYSLRMLNIENVDYIGFYRRNGVTLWEEENLTLVKFPNGIRTPEKTYEIKVKVEGHKFTAYVDGEAVTEYVEDKDWFDGNKVGIFQSYGDPAYDNFEIYSLDALSNTDNDFSYNRKLLLNLNLLDASLVNKGKDEPVSFKEANTFFCTLCRLSTESVSDESITPEYAVNLFIKALGYDKIPDTPDFYTAKKLLSEKVDCNSDVLTWENFVQMALNSFEIDTVTAIYGTKNNYQTGEEKLLGIYYGIFYDTAVLSDNGITALDGNSKIKKGQVGFDNGFIAYSADTDAQNYIGYNMKYFYSDDDEPKLLDIRLTPKSELFLYADEIISYSNNSLSYKLRGNDKTLKIKISKNAKCVYNGKSVSKIYDYMLDILSGDVTVIDNGGEQIVIICSYGDSVVERVDGDGEKLFDALKSSEVSWKNASNVNFYDSRYNEIDVSDISEDDVVSVAKSVDGKAIELLISKSKISGTVSEVDDESGNAIIGGEKYRLTKSFFGNSFVAPGDIGTLYLNADGNGVYFKHDTESPYTAAYLIKSVKSDGLDGRTRIQLFDGELKVYPCASSVKINDTVYRQNSAYTVLNSYQDIFEYKLNSKGEISYIGFPEGSYDEYNGGGITENGRFMGGTYYKSETRSFSGFMLADKNVKVFLVPLDRTRTDAYALTDISYFKDDVMYYSLVGYSHGGNRETAEIIVSEFDTYPQYQFNTACLVENIKNVLTDSGRDAIMLTVRYGNDDIRNVILNEDCLLESVSVGDVIQYTENLDGEVHSILPIFDISSEQVLQYGNTYYTASYRIVYGTVGEMRKNSFIFERSTGGTEIVTLNCPILIYDSSMRGDKLFSAEASDIRDSVGYGVDADKMLIRFEYGIPRQMIIYR